MAALPTSGGVRSLLAKFENSNSSNNNENNANNNSDISPPSRGRPSGDSDDNASNRPLSKVRASFVSVERNGQGSPTPGLLRRTDSYGTDKDWSQRSATVSPSTQLETASITSLGTSPQKIRTPLASFPRNEASEASESRPVPAVKEAPKPSTAPKADTAKPLGHKTTTKPADKPVDSATNKHLAPTRTIKKSASAVAISKDASTTNPTAKPVSTKEKKPPVPTSRTTTASSRTTAQLDKPAATRPTAARNAAIAPRPERANTPSRDTARTSTAQASPRTKAATRSPTRPVRLPASLVTPTAASSAKTGSLARSQSHANLKSSPKIASPKTLSRKPSTLRPDVSRLAAHAIPDRPKSRVSNTSSRSGQEDGFLARMMRPTASSASKTQDRVEPRSPPKLASAAKIARKNDAVPQAPKLATEKLRSSVSEPVSAAVEPKVAKVAAKMDTVVEVASPKSKPDVAKPEPVAEVISVVPEPFVAESPKIAVEAPPAAVPATDKPVEDIAVEKKPVDEKTEKKVENQTEEQTEEKPAEEHPVEEKPVEENPVEEKPVEEKPVEEKAVGTKQVEEKPVEEPSLDIAKDSTPEADASPEVKDQPEEPVPEVKVVQEEPEPEKQEQPVNEPAGTTDIIPTEPETSSKDPVSTAEEPTSVEVTTEKEEPKTGVPTEQI
ncbi:uncharacterized protein TRUGW13939_00839 [Talaromyces rugulosus]|uniref:Mucin-7 n=1 Tax=Talaromyces rugulosus TaxID=121627 RepID=A0A7H8QIF6_TALRU|nr:uncharacterized protein TRUGW13939_00839 [Talaromyces rugulosus]QKX53759.1 hypothetical protein TRUGW13939_00839 [Talaromyces rugulosus]